MKANPKATAIAILSIPEKLHDGAATIAHDLGKRGAQSITAGLNETFTKPKEKEKFSPSLRDVLTRAEAVL